jgi:aromatic ring-opening dioxygenase LigB subunit
MSLVFAAITPHSPLLVPAIGKEHLHRLKKTVEALKKLELELLAAKPEAILVISPHGPVADNHFTLDLNESYACNMKEFGVFDLTLPCRADMKLCNDIKERAEDAQAPLMLRSEVTLDYGTIVPLTCLTPKLGAFSIIPIFPSLLSYRSHHEFGKIIQDVLLHTTKRVAVIASAELSHRLTPEAPGGHFEGAAAFDQKIVELITGRNTSGLLSIDAGDAQDAGECGLTTLATFLGILDKIEAAPEILAYEGPFGIGYLTARFGLK